MHYDYLYYLLNKQAGGVISPEEELILEKWYNSLQNPIPVSTEEAHTDKGKSWETLQHQLTANAGAIAPVRTLWKRWFQAVAMLIMVAGVATLALLFNRKPQAKQFSYTAVETGRQKKSVTLSDGSRVWVNAHSRLRFADDFNENRHVILDHGEAYFEVTRDTNHPFRVKVDKLEVNVLGTAFNIQSFSQLNEIKVTVTQGKVAVNDSLNCHEKLLPAQELTYLRSNHQFRINSIDPSRNNDWKNGKIWLNNITLKELAVYIRNIYDYDVVFVNKELGNCKNTINFSEKDKLKEVLDLLKLLNKISYTIKDKTIYLDGNSCQ
ncbi:FecR family protein [Pseudoflavitalea rhizosphaerae]|uniref:FecR family protein n=1 Tax=Pseudoflavitalea rhizosphaerae TaxID=1884793 RepID=UPI000F8D3FE3|nr:FecR family protein [Pseudoflavitalea rhizosphaerae]